jgi:cytochrome P450
VWRRLQRPLRIGGRDLPAGVNAAACIYLVHRRGDVWSHPDRFLPDRFLDARPSPYEFLPFGGGVRRCIGMAFALFEMRVVLARMLRRFEVRPAPGPRVRTVRRNITLTPSGGMPVVVERRARA